MSEFFLAVCILAPLTFNVFIVSVVVQMYNDLRKENQRLVASALSSPSPVPAAVYVSDPTHREKRERLNAELLEDRAKEAANSHPLGL